MTPRLSSPIIRLPVPSSVDFARRRRQKDYNEPIIHHHVFYDGTSNKMKKTYLPAKIATSPLVPFEHLKKSCINKTIQMANEAIFLIFKQKIKADD
jgi:hypothetical protein